MSENENPSNIMLDLKAALADLGACFEAGVWTDDTLPDCYIVISPTGDTFEPGDDEYYCATEEARIYIYMRGSISTSVYAFKDRVVAALMKADFFAVSDSRYDGFDSETHYHVWSVLAAKEYMIRYDTEED